MATTQPRDPPETGNETLSESNAIVSELGRWASSDQRENITRGVLAEFLVARALSNRRPIRVAWDDHGIETLDGTTADVKLAAHLQKRAAETALTD